MAYYNSDAPVRAARLLKIASLIASRRPGERVGREALARACACSSKTIQRDISAIQETLIPLDYDPIERTYTLPEKGWMVPTVGVTPTDILALAMAKGLLVNTPIKPPYATEMITALDKVTAGLTPHLRSLLEAAAEGFSDPSGTARDYSQAPIGLLLEAIAGRKTIEMRYASRSSQSNDTRRVDPYTLDRREGRYFELHAFCHRRQEVRTFALDRITDVRFTGETFLPQKWENQEEGVVSGLRSGKLISLEVRFSAAVAPYARERTWGFLATFVEDTDGTLVMRGQVRGTDGIINELLRWNHHVEVIGGRELRDRMVEEVNTLATMYQQK